eukprot:scaffold45536_cov63-Phaeocystis_antarctica.AAC.1
MRERREAVSAGEVPGTDAAVRGEPLDDRGDHGVAQREDPEQVGGLKQRHESILRDECARSLVEPGEDRLKGERGDLIDPSLKAILRGRRGQRNAARVEPLEERRSHRKHAAVGVELSAVNVELRVAENLLLSL